MSYGHQITTQMVKTIEEQLIGGKIIGAITSIDEDCYGLKVEVGRGKKKKTLLVWVDCDEESNGPGYLEISEEG